MIDPRLRTELRTARSQCCFAPSTSARHSLALHRREITQCLIPLLGGRSCAEPLEDESKQFRERLDRRPVRGFGIDTASRLERGGHLHRITREGRGQEGVEARLRRGYTVSCRRPSSA